MSENIRSVNVQVQLASNVAGASVYRFVNWETSSPNAREVVTATTTTTGVNGILAQAIDTTEVDGFYPSSMIIPGGIAEISLGEIATQGAALRTGTGGQAFLADASTDVIVGYAVQGGAVGDIVEIDFTGYSGVVA